MASLQTVSVQTRFPMPATLLRRRSTDSMDSSGPSLQQALIAAFDVLPTAALLVEKSGRILAANAAGRALRETEPERVQERLMAALDSATPTDGVQLRHLDALDDCEDCYLALFSAPEKTLETRLATCRERWGLSERQTQVLGLLVDGACNKDIAVALDCAVNTVENHLGALLHRSQSESRAQLISRFWKES